MKLSIALIFSLFLSFSISPAVFAEDNPEDWGSLMKDYNSTSFDRIISAPEFNKAIETKESYAKKAKKSKKNKKSEINEGNSTSTPLGENQEMAVPVSPCPLLVLSTDVYYENTIIKQGFYLVNLKTEGGKYFLELNQGNKLPVAVIELKGHIAPGKMILTPQVSVENVDDKMIKINYSGDNLILESVLWKY